MNPDFHPPKMLFYPKAARELAKLRPAIARDKANFVEPTVQYQLSSINLLLTKYKKKNK